MRYEGDIYRPPGEWTYPRNTRCRAGQGSPQAQRGSGALPRVPRCSPVPLSFRAAPQNEQHSPPGPRQTKRAEPQQTTTGAPPRPRH